jgi:hypothetical protein
MIPIPEKLRVGLSGSEPAKWTSLGKKLVILE